MAEKVPQIITDDIGDRLKEEYSTKEGDAHIRYFYLKFGKESIEYKPQIIEALTKATRYSLAEWAKIEEGWDTLVFFQDVEEVSPKKERERENLLNEDIRKKVFEAIPSAHLHIILTRACLYTETRTYNKLTPSEIGRVMTREYGSQIRRKSTHIEHFYIFVQGFVGKEGFLVKRIGDKDINIHDMAFEVLKTLPEKWNSVEPTETWGATFFGEFKKETPIMTEREREKLLNGEVRRPLIDTLKHQLATLTKGKDIKVRVEVIITRACKYTPRRTK